MAPINEPTNAVPAVKKIQSPLFTVAPLEKPALPVAVPVAAVFELEALLPDFPAVPVAVALAGAELPMLVPEIKRPLPMVLRVVHDEEEGTGCADGVTG